MLTIVTCVLSPLLAGCVVEPPPPSLLSINAGIDVMLFADVLLNFLTAFQDPYRDIIVTSPWHIAMHYMKSMCLVDTLAAVPIDWMLHAASALDLTQAQMLRCLKFLRFYHMFMSNNVHLNLGDTAINPSFLSLLKMVLVLAMFWHLTACTYTRLSKESLQMTDETAGKQVAVSFDMQDRVPYAEQWHMPIGVWDSGAAARYLYSLSWAIALTCQTDRPRADTYTQLIVSDFFSLSGLFIMTAIVGAATAAIADIQTQRSETTKILQRVAQYMRSKQLPKTIRRRVLAYYSFHRSSTNILEHEDVLQGLPHAMSMQIKLLVHKAIFVKLPLFWLCTEEEILLIVQCLKPCILVPGEMVVKEQTIGVGLFLLMKGAIETTQNCELLVVLLAVAAFGEKALQTPEQPSEITIRALRFCETSVLHKDHWHTIERLNPSIRRWLDVYVAERDKKIRDPLVKTQSQQTRKATLEGSSSGIADWATMSRPTILDNMN